MGTHQLLSHSERLSIQSQGENNVITANHALSPRVRVSQYSASTVIDVNRTARQSRMWTTLCVKARKTWSIHTGSGP